MSTVRFLIANNRIYSCLFKYKRIFWGAQIIYPVLGRLKKQDSRLTSRNNSPNSSVLFVLLQDKVALATITPPKLYLCFSPMWLQLQIKISGKHIWLVKHNHKPEPQRQRNIGNISFLASQSQPHWKTNQDDTGMSVEQTKPQSHYSE